MRNTALAAPSGSTVRQALLVFASVSTVLALVLGAAMVFLVRQSDKDHGLHRADQLARILANDIVGRELDAGDPQSTQVLDELMRGIAREESIVRTKIWTPEGVVLWADDDRLVGKQYELAPEDAALLGTQNSYAELTDLERPENEYETALRGQFIEVYAGFFDTDGDPLLFEAYLPARELGTGALRADLVALALLWLVLLLGLMLPLAASLARRVDRAQAEQQRLLRHAVEASELERKRLAQDLHDGVIQDLAGVGYVFSALESQLADAPQALSTARLASDIVRRDVLALRTLSTDLYPPDLGGEGLGSALEEMLDDCERKGLETSLELSPTLDLSPRTALLAYRTVREALRNVLKHAQATRVDVAVQRVDDEVLVRVRDDGKGFDPTAGAPEGHLGLRVMRDGVTDAHGELELGPAPGGGTLLEAKLPAA